MPISPRYLGSRVHLESTVAGDETYESYWPEIEGLALSDVTVDFPIAMSTAKGTFVDLAALHVITSSSVRHLARLAPQSEITTARFRPSMVFDLDADIDGFVENSWAERTARVGESRWQFGPASPRCVMTTLAQQGLPDDRGVLQAIATHNRLEMPGFGNFACLGRVRGGHRTRSRRCRGRNRLRRLTACGLRGEREVERLREHGERVVPHEEFRVQAYGPRR